MLGLSGSRPEVIIRNLPLVFDNIIQLLVHPPRISNQTLSVGQQSFDALCLLLENISVSFLNFIKLFKNKRNN